MTEFLTLIGSVTMMYLFYKLSNSIEKRQYQEWKEFVEKHNKIVTTSEQLPSGSIRIPSREETYMDGCWERYRKKTTVPDNKKHE